ncbi:unnamed protein product [Notodromas monacha]|uniref:Uncharacterized protein n=1 Tax=Notodromas monacha TaxID=399045 RepID=A0A7R9C173_9CRUS|nr:unnamed protein product [Notodromas monacha]CAG0924142.1 unnamed protein product [Notodromas monacha]
MGLCLAVTSTILWVLLVTLQDGEASSCAEVGGRLACEDICEVRRPALHKFQVDFVGDSLDLDCIRYKGLKEVRLFNRTFSLGKVLGMEEIVRPWSHCFFKYTKKQKTVKEEPRTSKPVLKTSLHKTSSTTPLTSSTVPIKQRISTTSQPKTVPWEEETATIQDQDNRRESEAENQLEEAPQSVLNPLFEELEMAEAPSLATVQSEALSGEELLTRWTWPLLRPWVLAKICSSHPTFWRTCPGAGQQSRAFLFIQIPEYGLTAAVAPLSGVCCSGICDLLGVLDDSGGARTLSVTAGKVVSGGSLSSEPDSGKKIFPSSVVTSERKDLLALLDFGVAITVLLVY